MKQFDAARTCNWRAISATLAASLFACPLVAAADESADAQAWALHGQSTLVEQGNLAFTSPYRGSNSLDPAARGRETFDATLYAGLRPWQGGELWVEPEIDQGFGLDNTLGVAGFTSGEGYKVGKHNFYLQVHRVLFRQTIDLGGEATPVEADLGQLAQETTANRLVLTLGKFGVTDVFDTNKYAHDPRGDFMNWSLIDAGTFDYAADAWGFTGGAAAEWYQGRWTFRGGAFLLSNVPNSTKIDTRFHQFQLIGEVEERHSLFGQPGRLMLTGFDSRGEMGRYSDAIRLAETVGGAPQLPPVRRYASRPGVSADLEQQITKDLGGFIRIGWADGAYEAYEFSDIDRSYSAGLALGGGRWGRPHDTVGLAGVINQASPQLRAFLASGGLGILVGDGRLPHPGDERILETYYSLALNKAVRLSFDYQFVDNPAYNRDRGPVSVLAVRVHTQL